MERHVCIHGHFYQPPRENPWLEDIELQDSAYPHHDWNDRITAECYEPNTVSRILDGNGWIKKIVNNYARISFNFGPTLLSWMQKKEPEVYRAIIESDRESLQIFSGHGSAFAQAYNHMIMPLANDRDKYTQVLWGIRDFEYRFERFPEGMWLPETAVDLKTLENMAEQGIRFTVLAPYQARRFRRIGSGEEEWHHVGPEGIDSTMPYRVNLPSGRTIDVFFYNGDISKAVAFEKLLSNGERFAKRLLSGFEKNGTGRLVNIATDGETYGHHHRHGDMALAYALHYIEANKLAKITNCARFLAQYPPDHEAEIKENTAWSCAHGVDRWRKDCGCNSGMHREWNQAWRAPLRNALDWLRDTTAAGYEETGRGFFKDPWAARNDYIAVIHDRSEENVHRFLSRHAGRELSREEETTALKLLELQRHAMLMYTSCGWFFDEISGIETVQVIKYAARVIQLAHELFHDSPEPRFLEMLAEAKSNLPEHQNGAHIYEKFVKPAMVDLPKVGAHYAICSLFDNYGEKSRIYCYEVTRGNHQNRLAGEAKLAVGRALVTSMITREAADLSYAVVNFGNHNAAAGVRLYQDDQTYEKMVQEVTGTFDRADFPGVIRLLDQHFGSTTYSLKELFRDKQRMVLDQILDTTLSEVASDYRRIYDRHVGLIRFLKDLHIPQPKTLFSAAEFVINSKLRRAFMSDLLDLEYIKALLGEAEKSSVPLDGAGLGYIIGLTLERLGEELRAEPMDHALVGHLDEVAGLVRSLPFEVDLWKMQNIYYRLLRAVYPGVRERAGQGDEEAQAWCGRFNSLGDKLQVRRDF